MTTHDNQHPLAGDHVGRAFRLVAGDVEPTTPRPFTDHGQFGPGNIDKRCILQTDHWIDVDAVTHRLIDMSEDYRRNVLNFLRREGAGWITQATAWVFHDAIVGIASPQQAREELELLDLLAPGWTDHTPLGRRLHELNQTHPEPIAGRRPRVTAVESNHPETLSQQDRGTWTVTTVSGTTYLIDLDRGRVQRVPASPAGAHQAPGRLPEDGEWTHLTAIIQCSIDKNLVILDNRHYGPGYRVSTAVASIERRDSTT